MQYKGRGLQGVRNAVKKAMDAIDRPPEITKGTFFLLLDVSFSVPVHLSVWAELFKSHLFFLAWKLSATIAKSALQQIYAILTTTRFTWHTFMNQTIYSGWRGGRQGLFNPDIDHQQGDVLFGNTYLTTRIPANWNDPEYV